VRGSHRGKPIHEERRICAHWATASFASATTTSTATSTARSTVSGLRRGRALL